MRTRDWLDFAQIPAAAIPIISREQQFAEKLHAYTLPRAQSPNSRVRDLVDMMLLVDPEQLQRQKTTDSIMAAFRRRKTHAIPAVLEPPPRNREKSFFALAAGCGLQVNLDEAFTKIEEFFRSLLIQLPPTH